MTMRQSTRRVLGWAYRQVNRGTHSVEEADRRFWTVLGVAHLLAVVVWTFTFVRLRLNFGIGIDLVLLILAWRCFDAAWRKEP